MAVLPVPAKQKFLYFETIKKVLDKSLNALCAERGISEKKAAETFVMHLKNMSKEWFSGKTPTIAYEDPLCRLAYLYCHVGVNANLIEYIIRETAAVRNFIEKKLDAEGELRVCAFGGGPGTECLGMAKHLWKTRQSKEHANVSFTVLDRVTEWSETWNGIEQVLRDFMKRHCGLYKDWPFSFNKTFTDVDLKDCSKFANFADLFGQDLFILNYVTSELCGDFDDFEPVFKRIVQAAPKGAFFIIVDREEKTIMKLAKRLVQTNGLIEECFDSEVNSMDRDEQITALEPYVSMIGRNPRLRWGNPATGCGAFWYVARKK